MKANSSEWAPLRLLWNVLCIAAPTAMGNAFEYLPVVFGLSIVGHLPDGRAALEVVSLARAWFNMTALAPSFGLLTALRTLCPQAVGGGRPELNRLYIRRAFCFVALGAIPCCGLQWACAPTLTAVLGTPPALARDVQAYALRLIPQYFGVAGMTILQRVYQAHDMVLSNMAICGAVCAVAPLLQWAFVHGLGWGYIGIAWAAGTSNLLYVALQLPHLVSVGQGYLFFGNSSASSSSSLSSSSAAAEDRGAWGEALSREGLWEYTVLMVPGFLQAVAEWSVLEFIIFAVSVLQQSQEKGLIAASAVVGNLQAVFIMAWCVLLFLLQCICFACSLDRMKRSAPRCCFRPLMQHAPSVVIVV
jgi:MATE family multidrug resistance protein